MQMNKEMKCTDILIMSNLFSAGIKELFSKNTSL